MNESMITDYISQIWKLRHMLTTYNTGLLQTKAYRILKSNTSRLLLAYNISSADWAFLGVLYQHPKGIRSSDLAVLLGVERPFVTQQYDSLHAKGFVHSQSDAEDKRVKIITLTQEGKQLVPHVEKYLHTEMRKLLGSIKTTEIITYLKVLNTIVENGEKVSVFKESE